jgi:hypothetical protein
MKGFCVSTIHTSDLVDDLKAAALLSNTLLKLDMTEAPSNYAELDCESVSGVLLMAGGNDMFSRFLTLLGGNLRGTVRKRKWRAPALYNICISLEILRENLIDQVGFVRFAVGIPNIVNVNSDGEKGVMTGPKGHTMA